MWTFLDFHSHSSASYKSPTKRQESGDLQTATTKVIQKHKPTNTKNKIKTQWKQKQKDLQCSGIKKLKQYCTRNINTWGV